VIDACAFHEWPSTETLVGYMDEAWHELLMRPGDIAGPVNVRGGRLFTDPRGQKQAAVSSAVFADAKGGVPGSSFETFQADVLDARPDLERVVIGYEQSLSSTVYPHPWITREVVRAANDWTAEEWLARDDRVYGMILVSTLLPDDAAAEIRRAGQNERFVAIALGCNGLARPFGDPAYRAIHEAAAELDLPFVVQIGSDAATGQAGSPVGGGAPVTYAEFRALGAHSHMSHATSFVLQGAFARHPNLKLLLVGGGAVWVPQYVWRLDYGYKGRRHMVPWLKRLPSEYFLDHVRVSTHSLERPRQPERLARALGVMPGIEHVLTYTGCWPSPDSETPEAIGARLPKEWHDAVFGDNARDFFRWPDRPRAAATAAAAETTGG